MGLSIRCLWIILLSELCRFTSQSPGKHIDSRLLVVSFDGFRYDYFNRSLTPNFGKLLNNSSYSGKVYNVFPTQTFPNHFSIATGLYAEDHGVLGSEAMDPDTGSIIKYGYKLFHYDPKVTPIWTLNEMGSHRSGCMMWPGCDMDYRGINVTYSVLFNLSISWEDRIKTSISWFTKPEKPANLVFLYFESPDYEGHIYGPNSNQTNQQIAKADDAVAKILKTLEANNLMDVNLVLLSDHGMEATNLQRTINLTDIIGNRGTAVGTSPVLQIFPKPGMFEELYSRLKKFSTENTHFKVYKKQEIPNEYHYKNNKRAPPLLVIAEPKYSFQDLYQWMYQERKIRNLEVTNETEYGVHGYPPTVTSMQPFLIARGPKFKNYFKGQLIRTVDLYGIFADVLGLEVKKYLAKASTQSAAIGAFRLNFLWLASWLGLCFLFVVFIFALRRRATKNLGYVLVEKEESCA